MRAQRDLIWLVFIVVAVTLAVAFTPCEARLPRPRFPTFTSTPTRPAAEKETFVMTYRATRTPDNFSYNCQGNNHGKVYEGFAGKAINYAPYDAEQGLLDHP